jgi:hypothetical protein
MAINAGRHPILETLHTNFVVSCFFVDVLHVYFVITSIVNYVDCIHGLSIVSAIQPNNIFLSEASNMVLVMGPNM